VKCAEYLWFHWFSWGWSHQPRWSASAVWGRGRWPTDTHWPSFSLWKAPFRLLIPETETFFEDWTRPDRFLKPRCGLATTSACSDCKLSRLLISCWEVVRAWSWRLTLQVGAIRSQWSSFWGIPVPSGGREHQDSGELLRLFWGSFPVWSQLTYFARSSWLSRLLVWCSSANFFNSDSICAEETLGLSFNAFVFSFSFEEFWMSPLKISCEKICPTDRREKSFSLISPWKLCSSKGLWSSKIGFSIWSLSRSDR